MTKAKKASKAGIGNPKMRSNGIVIIRIKKATTQKE
jgi:hypothetical protein